MLPFRFEAAPEDLFLHALATLHSTAFREANIGALRQDWPRIPLPQSAEVLRASAALGREAAALLTPKPVCPASPSVRRTPSCKRLR